MCCRTCEAMRSMSVSWALAKETALQAEVHNTFSGEWHAGVAWCA